jgi:hypothetical protein
MVMSGLPVVGSADTSIATLVVVENISVLLCWGVEVQPKSPIARTPLEIMVLQ